MAERIAFITYETPFAPGGGVAAVMGRLPAQVGWAAGRPVTVVTPFHHQIPKTVSLAGQLERLAQVAVPLGTVQVSVEVLRLEREVTWLFLRPADQRLFAGRRHPYDTGQEQADIAANLLRDALFFGAAVARALPAVDPQASWTLLMQDWEAATAILALQGVVQAARYRAFLTIHNSYDSGVTDAELRRFGINPVFTPGATVLQRALPLVHTPVFTVSDQFARDFSEEVLQSEIMAPHLKTLLTSRLLGVDNGLFADLTVDSGALLAARRGDFEPLQEWKAANRAQALQALDELQPGPERPLWGDRQVFQRDDAPWFVLAGRDDPRQKGYDVACQAIAAFLAAGGNARFIFFPIPGDEGLPGLSFMKKLAGRYPESVLALPFIFQEGYFAVLQGATYGVMPSLYEPFGMANEFYLKGAVGIGRATGGILQQIIPLRSVASYSHAVQVRAERRYGAAAAPTGLLYRERDGLPSTLADWQGLNAAAYRKDGRSPDRLEQRSTYPLFLAMAAELRLSITDGERLYREQPELYYQMLTAGIAYIRTSFSWERAAQSYARYLIDSAATPAPSQRRFIDEQP